MALSYVVLVSQTDTYVAQAKGGNLHLAFVEAVTAVQLSASSLFLLADSLFVQFLGAEV